MIFLRCIHRVNFIFFLQMLWSSCVGHCTRSFFNSTFQKKYWINPVYCEMKKHTCSFKYFEQWIWWRHDGEKLSTLLTICDGNPLVTGRFPSRWVSNEECWNFLWYMFEHDWVHELLIGDLRRHYAHAIRDPSGYGLSHWETTSQCDVVCHWLSAYPE